MAASTSSLAEQDSEGRSTRTIRSSLAALVLSALLLPLAGLPPSVVLDVDGERVVARTAGPAAAQALELDDVALDGMAPFAVRASDATHPDAALQFAAWVSTDTVRVTQVTVEDDRREIVIPREIRRIEDPRLLRGVVRVERPGRDGLLAETDLVTRVDGVETSRIAQTLEVVTGSQERIERHGTMVTPPASVWDDLAKCESGQRWDIVRFVNESTSYHGGLQFLPSTWNAFRPVDFPEHAHEASRSQQIEVAERVRDHQGWGAWPACSRRLGLR